MHKQFVDDPISDDEVAEAIHAIPFHYADQPASSANPPNEPAPAPAPSEPAAAAAPAAPAAAAAGSGAASGGIAGTTDQGTGGVAPQAAAAPQDILSQLRTQYQIDLPQDPGQAAQFLGQAFRQAQQAQELARYGQMFLAQQGEFERWRAQQQQAAMAPTAEKPWWNEFWQPPEYNQAWEQLLTTDPQGNIIPKPGTPPDILPKYQAYQQFQRERAKELMQNPFQFFEKPIQTLAQKIAAEEIRRHLNQFQEQAFATEFTKANASWLYQRGQNNEVLMDPVTRAPALSQWGSRFRDYVLHAQQVLGIQDVKGQEQFAMGMVQRDYAISQMPGPGPVAGAGGPGAPVNPRDAANAQFLQQQQAGRTAIPGQQPIVPANTPPQKISLAERLRAQFQANGITDTSLR